jgi:predicted glycogen debranching enzyme
MAGVPDLHAEWLEADGLGGFASGSVGGPRTRRYHALLLAARRPPTERVVLVNGLDAQLETDAGVFALSSQAYLPDVTHPDGATRLVEFACDPWPSWTFALPDGARVVQELFVPRGRAAVVLAWRRVGGGGRAALAVRPFLAGRDYHALQRENGAFGFAPTGRGDALWWQSYPGLPAVFCRANAVYAHDPVWYRGFRYDAERARGLDFVEDCAAPGVLRFDLAAGEALLVFAAEGHADAFAEAPLADCVARARDAERTRRAAFASPLDRAADAYLVRRGAGQTIVAGYPWFTDWGRDTFIALRGLCIAPGRLDEARAVLVEWAGAVSEGMLPNRFPDSGETPEFNAVDASLWFCVAAGELRAALRGRGQRLSRADDARLADAVQAILEGYAKGTRHRIGVDADGLVAAGEPGVQLTWMDAKVGDWVVTPRIGKPVEVQALWLAALRVGARRDARWRTLAARAAQSFRARFWNDARGCLYDVIDVDHEAGRVDAALRPNQVLAVGGLPVAALDGARARSVVDVVERELWTPLGPRSLAPGEPGYAPRYAGGVAERDGAYHQGTVWPWLAGPFVEAWLRVRGGGADARREARARFVQPLLDHLRAAGLGHVSEVADAEPPHTAGGCPFQAWSLGELLRLLHGALAEETGRGRAPGP